jgi:hypothetical protein
MEARGPHPTSPMKISFVPPKRIHPAKTAFLTDPRV